MYEILRKAGYFYFWLPDIVSRKLSNWANDFVKAKRFAKLSNSMTTPDSQTTKKANSRCFIPSPTHGLINYIDQSKMSSSKKNLLAKGLCGRCLSECIYCRYNQSCWYFRPRFVNYCPSNLLSDSTPPSLPCVNKYTVCNGGEYGVLGLTPSVKFLYRSSFR